MTPPPSKAGSPVKRSTAKRSGKLTKWSKEIAARGAVVETQVETLRHDFRNARMVNDATAEAVQEIRSEVIRLRTRVYAVASTLLVLGGALGWLLELGIRG